MTDNNTRLTAASPPTTNPSSSTSTAPTSIPSHPAPVDAANTSSGVTADAQNPKDVPFTTTRPKHGTSSSSSTAAAREAMDRASSWTPSFNRRQSWNKEDQKHAMQMTGIQDVKTGPGFSEQQKG